MMKHKLISINVMVMSAAPTSGYVSDWCTVSLLTQEVCVCVSGSLGRSEDDSHEDIDTLQRCMVN